MKAAIYMGKDNIEVRELPMPVSEKIFRRNQKIILALPLP